MSRPDKNYLSFAGLRGTPEEPIVLRLGVIRPPDGTSADALKFSDCQHVQVHVEEIHGGYEDAVDVNNRCKNVSIYAGRIYPRGRYVATIKGQSEDITLFGEIIGSGKETDIDIGGHSDQARGRTRGVRLNVKKSGTVDVRVLHAWDPIILNGNLQAYRIDDRMQGWFAHVWRVLKRLIPKL